MPGASSSLRVHVSARPFVEHVQPSPAGSGATKLITDGQGVGHRDQAARRHVADARDLERERDPAARHELARMGLVDREVRDEDPREHVARRDVPRLPERLGAVADRRVVADDVPAREAGVHADAERDPRRAARRRRGGRRWSRSRRFRCASRPRWRWRRTRPGRRPRRRSSPTRRRSTCCPGRTSCRTE